MSLVTILGIIIGIVIVGVVMFYVNSHINMSSGVKQVLNFTVVAILIILVATLLLQLLGIDLQSIRIGG